METNLVKTSGKNLALGFALVLLGGALAAGGIYVGETDDAPGAALMGILLAIALTIAGLKTGRRKG